MLTRYTTSPELGGGPGRRSADDGMADDEAIDAFLAAAPELEDEVSSPSPRRERRSNRRLARKAVRDAKKTRRRGRKTERSYRKAARRDERRTTRRGRKTARNSRRRRIREWVSAERRVSARLVFGVIGVALVVGVLFWHERRLDVIESRGATVDQVAQLVRNEPGTRLFSLTTPEGTRIVVSVGADGQAFVDASPLPALPDGLTYQLWGATARERVSLAVIGGSPAVEAFRLPTSIGSMAITVESDGGVVTSTSPSLAFGPVPAAT